MEVCNIISRCMFSFRFTCVFSALLFLSSVAQAGYVAVVNTNQDCTMVGNGYGGYTLTCRPVYSIQYIYVPDAPPTNASNGAGRPPASTSSAPPPPPPKCDVIAAENELANQKCNRDALNIKAAHSASCGSLPAIAYKDIGVGVDIGSIITATINGKVQEEYHPQESCIRSASDSFEVATADCKVKESERKLAAAKLGCK